MNRISKAVLAGISAALVFSSPASADSAGSASVDTGEDPLVTLSYIDEVLKPQLKAEIMKEVAALIDQSYTLPASSEGFEVVHLYLGQTLTASSSLEFILRAGECNAVVYLDVNISNGVGLSDLTAGSEITNGQRVTKNHYIIIPRADGRGISITSAEAYVMVRGEYEVVSQ